MAALPASLLRIFLKCMASGRLENSTACGWHLSASLLAFVCTLVTVIALLVTLWINSTEATVPIQLLLFTSLGLDTIQT